MPTGRGWAAAGASGALLLLWLSFGEIELLATSLFLFLALVGGMLLVRRRTPQLEVTRRIYPAQAHEGDRVTVEIEVAALATARHLSLKDTVHGLGTAGFAAGVAPAGQHLTARYEVHCRARGIYPVGPAAVAVADPLSLVERTAVLGGVDRLTVYPAVEPLTGFPVVQGLDPAVQSTHPSFTPQGGEDFFTLREYRSGDDLRKVHWPSSAKRGELMIKQLEAPWKTRALVLLDQRAERYPYPEAFEHAVRGAASVLCHLYEGGFSPELWTTERAGGERARSRFTQALEMLAAVGPLPHLDLLRVVDRLRRQGVGGGALVMVTGLPDDGILAAHRMLGRDFGRTVVLAAAGPADDTAGAFRRLGAATVTTTPADPWGPAWRAAMESSWSTASPG